MIIDGAAPPTGGMASPAPIAVQVGPVPAWVTECSFPENILNARSSPSTCLLVDQQIHAEFCQTYFHQALRLETIQAVQEESPWQVKLDPRCRQITLHAITTWRNGQAIHHCNLATARLTDRLDAAWPGQGGKTLVLLLEDIRPGDILEWRYTITHQSNLLPKACFGLFALPSSQPVGKFFFSVQFNSSRPLRWRTSDPGWQPVMTHTGSETSWCWTEENYGGLWLEENSPRWLVPFPWIQISDCPDWPSIATAFAEAWTEEKENQTVAEMTAGIVRDCADLPSQIERALQIVQGEFRHLPVRGELDSQPPNPLAVVARRRYGDGKDLAVLLAGVLRKLGVSARLILAHSQWGQSLLEFLPAPNLFDQVLVEYQLEEKLYWVDPALRLSASGVSNRSISECGLGLPITYNSTDLIKPPFSPAANFYELHESILLDTTGAWSLLAVVVSARGDAAEKLRVEWEEQGADAMAQNRLRLCQDRYKTVRRVDALRIRDNPAAQEFFLAEIFEIKDFLTLDPKTKWFHLNLANNYIADLLLKPNLNGRRAHFALPHPTNILHTIELHSVALPPTAVPQRRVETDYLYFTRSRQTMAGDWTMILSLTTLAGSIPPEDLEQHAAALQEIRERSAWLVSVTAGEPRPRQRGDFGALPVSWNPEPVLPLTPAIFQPAVCVTPPASEKVVAPMEVPQKKRRRTRRTENRPKGRFWPILVGCLLGLFLIFLVFLAARYANLLPGLDHVPKISVPVPTPMPALN